MSLDQGLLDSGLRLELWDIDPAVVAAFRDRFREGQA